MPCRNATNYGPLKARTRMAKSAHRLQSIAFVLLLAAPVLMILAKNPAILLLELAAGAIIIGLTVLMHAVTLAG